MCHFDHDDCIWKFPISRFSRIYIGNWRPTLFGLRIVTFPKYASATKSPVCQYFQLSLQACPVLFQSFLLLKRNWKLCMHPKRRSLTPRVLPFFVEISEGKYFLSTLSPLQVSLALERFLVADDKLLFSMGNTFMFQTQSGTFILPSTVAISINGTDMFFWKRTLRSIHHVCRLRQTRACVASTMCAGSEGHVHCDCIACIT